MMVKCINRRTKSGKTQWYHVMQKQTNVTKGTLIIVSGHVNRYSGFELVYELFELPKSKQPNSACRKT